MTLTALLHKLSNRSEILFNKWKLYTCSGWLYTLFGPCLLPILTLIKTIVSKRYSVCIIKSCKSVSVFQSLFFPNWKAPDSAAYCWRSTKKHVSTVLFLFDVWDSIVDFDQPDKAQNVWGINMIEKGKKYMKAEYLSVLFCLGIRFLLLCCRTVGMSFISLPK